MDCFFEKKNVGKLRVSHYPLVICDSLLLKPWSFYSWNSYDGDFPNRELLVDQITRGFSCKKTQSNPLRYGEMMNGIWSTTFSDPTYPPHLGFMKRYQLPQLPQLPGVHHFLWKNATEFQTKHLEPRRMFDVDSIYPPSSNSATNCGDTWHERFFSEQMKPGISPSCGEKRPACLKPWRREWFI